MFYAKLSLINMSVSLKYSEYLLDLLIFIFFSSVSRVKPGHSAISVLGGTLLEAKVTPVEQVTYVL